MIWGYLFIFPSCIHKKKDLKKKETIAIITLLYNEECSKFPVPPPPSKGIPIEDIQSLSWEVPKVYDTDQKIHKKKFAVSIYQESKINSLDMNNMPAVFRDIFFGLSNGYSNDNLKGLKLKDSEGATIPIITEHLKIQEIKTSNNVLGVLFISNISFNKELDKAILKFGSYTHGLAGFTAIYAMEKMNGKWHVSETETLSES